MTRALRLLPWLTLALVAAVMAMPRPAAAQEPETARLFVRGQATISVRPDVAVVTLGAVVRRESAGAAFDQANSLINQVNQLLRAQGVPERDVTTRQLSLTPEFGRPPSEGGPAPLVAWRAVNLLSIKIRDFGTIGQVIDGAARILGNDAQISGITFMVEDTDRFARAARDEAIADARQRAEQMAAAAGVRLVRILSITETSAPPPTPTQFAVTAAAPAAAPVARAAPEVAPGEQNLTVTVEIVYEIA